MILYDTWDFLSIGNEKSEDVGFLEKESYIFVYSVFGRMAECCRRNAIDCMEGAVKAADAAKAGLIGDLTAGCIAVF